MSIDAMKLALEALEQLQGGCTDSDDGTVETITVWCPEIITALRAAIEEAKKQEPVGWVECDGVVVWYNRDAAIGRDLYTTPPQLQAQPNQEPVAWMFVNTDGECEQIEYIKNEPMPDDPSVTPLYTAPRQWQRLTNEERNECVEWAISLDGTTFSASLARAIEAKLREKNT